MSFLLECPHCGPRSVYEFRYGGEVRPRPSGEVTMHGWQHYLYMRANVAGPQREWWYHRAGCRRWFQATRDTRTNAVLSVSRGEQGG